MQNEPCCEDFNDVICRSPLKNMYPKFIARAFGARIKYA